MITNIVKDKIQYTTIESSDCLKDCFHISNEEDDLDLNIYKFVLTIQLFGNNMIRVYAKNSSRLQETVDGIFLDTTKTIVFNNPDPEDIIVEVL